MKLEDVYSKSPVHDYIRDHGLDPGFDYEELAQEIKMNPRTLKILIDLGFLDRDIQVYSTSSRLQRKDLARQFQNEIEKICNENQKFPPASLDDNRRSRPFTSYGGGLYGRRKRRV
ncbi:MAG: hypothetical protein IJR94_02365 [Synergistaceae bacterium]|nr:hypothetical protein [Synergistaceae bacterium]